MGDGLAFVSDGLSDLAGRLEGSPILAIANEIRGMIRAGRDVCNLTIGDFDTSEYPIPAKMKAGLIEAIEAGQTNYPPSNGIPELREAVAASLGSRGGFAIDPADVVITSGARPVIYAAYRALCDEGDEVVYPVPSWNNKHYCAMVGAKPVVLDVGPEDHFFPRVEALAPHLKSARMVVLNSPLNPTGTLMRHESMAALCDAIVAENARRQAADGQRPLFLLYDQIYWMLTHGDLRHAHPIAVNPAMADYTVLVDGVSKCFAATGLRVGWGVGPRPVIGAMNRVLAHAGAWAPKPAQRATAALLEDDAAVDAYLDFIRSAALERLGLLHERLMGMKRPGIDIEAKPPEGAIYLSVRFGLRGCTLGDGTVLQTSDDVRRWLLEAAGIGVVPFPAFGAAHAPDWYRFSVGAVSVAALGAAMDRLAAALEDLTPPGA
jgi:aspartate aminotransferase